MALTRDEFFDDDFPMDFGDLPGQISQVGQELFPVDALSDEELMEFQALQNRAQRLSPIELPQSQGNNRIAGNPYSYNTAPLINAVTQGLGKVVNAARQRRLMNPQGEGKALAQGADEIRERANQLEGREKQMLLEEADAVDRAAEATSVASRLKALTNKAQTAKAQQEKQSAFMEELFPDLAQRVFDTRGRMMEEDNKQEGRMEKLAQEYNFDLALDNVEYANRLSEMDKELQNSLAEIEARANAKKGGDGSTDTISGQDLNNLRQVSKPLLEDIKMEIGRLENAWNPGPETKEKIAGLKAQYRNILESLFTKTATVTGYNESEIEELLQIPDVDDEPTGNTGSQNSPTSGNSAVDKWWEG